jgi:hypothetical protein
MATWQEFLSSSPQVCGGEICATGTRIPVTVILDSLAEGATKDEVLASYLFSSGILCRDISPLFTIQVHFRPANCWSDVGIARGRACRSAAPKPSQRWAMSRYSVFPQTARMIPDEV